MILQNFHQTQPVHDPFDKQKAQTPATADSEILHQISSNLRTQEGPSKEHDFVENNIFRILQEKFQATIEERQPTKLLQKPSKVVYQENIQECEIKIGVKILRENGQVLKIFLKTIIKSIESQDAITLIFDKQYEKIKMQQCIKYQLETFIQTSDKFSKVVTKFDYQIPKNSKKWSVVTLDSNNKQQDKSLNIQLQKLGNYFIKLLSIRLPTKLIDQFYDFKYKLLNKSDILSSIQSISELRGILLQLSRQNMGSRILQKLLSKAKSDQLQSVISQLKHHFVEMIFDKYGNYVFSKIFKMANIQQRKMCLQILSNNFTNLVKSKQGTHCIQSIIDNLKPNQVLQWFSDFSSQQIIDLSINEFSMHFVQKILKIIPSFSIHLDLLHSFKLLSQDKFGIVVLKSILYQISELQYNKMQDYNIRSAFLSQCEQNLYQIAFTQYGHYIIQELLAIYSYQQLQNIINYITCYVVYFCKNKFSSSIVKKLIESYGDYFSIPTINVILSQGLQELMQISSGQFILHRLLEKTNDENLKIKLTNQMMLKAPHLKNYQKRNKWMKFFKLN